MNAGLDGEEELFLPSSDEIIKEAFLHLLVPAVQHHRKEGQHLSCDVVGRFGKVRKDSQQSVVRVEGTLHFRNDSQLSAEYAEIKMDPAGSTQRKGPSFQQNGCQTQEISKAQEKSGSNTLRRQQVVHFLIFKPLKISDETSPTFRSQDFHDFFEMLDTCWNKRYLKKHDTFLTDKIVRRYLSR